MIKKVLILALISVSLFSYDFCNSDSDSYKKNTRDEQRDMDKICMYKMAYNDALYQAERDMLEERENELTFSKWIIYVDAKYMTSQEILSSISWGYKIGQTPVLVENDLLILGSWERKANAIDFQNRALSKYFKYFKYKPERRDNYENKVYRPSPRVMQKVVDNITKQALQEAEMNVFIKDAELPEEIQVKLDRLNSYEKTIARLENNVKNANTQIEKLNKKVKSVKKDYSELKTERFYARKAYKKLKEANSKLKKSLKSKKQVKAKKTLSLTVEPKKVEKKIALRYYFKLSGENEAYSYNGKIKKEMILKEENFGETTYIKEDSVAIIGFFTSDEDEVYGLVDNKKLFVNKDDLKVK